MDKFVIRSHRTVESVGTEQKTEASGTSTEVREVQRQHHIARKQRNNSSNLSKCEKL